MIWNNLTYKLILVFIYSLFGTYLAAKYFEDKFRRHNYLKQDRYKQGKKLIPHMGGAAALVGILVSVVLSQLIVYEFSTASLLIYFFVVIIHALFGLIDDLIYTNNLIKIVSPYFMALPVFLLTSSTILYFGQISIDFGAWYIYLIAPIYFIVISNLVNTHSGFNGLSTGLTWIILLALGIRTILIGEITDLFYLLPIFGGVTILWYFDKYPSRMLPTNVGSLMMGAAVGAYIIVTHALLFGIIIFLPHIIDFGLYLYSVIVKRKNFEKIKYGKLRKDGTIVAPTPLKLKFLFPYYFRLTEKQTVWILYAITAIFCAIGLIMGV
jgi:UDP-N-acetylglucosamine--dolichyl-phosphate N-acetylglucosaminephosphotransferase